ncbi:HET-domain-containing protein [Hyaloscypha variabilis F]|uniref:HET-domain-containing protein n=1 Tax=Hyaloscypha variabilis (strain UAMH 11265 / GT02V1 / F) TaxID=1149755 RepID=A0A2J6R0F0_HYAVF|nr:HET-domain-containing protein [Hyaloscypha variabilis F]
MPPLNIYKPLRDNEIRIAEIESASSEDEDVHCHLIHVSRNASGDYQSLSYAWGPEEELDKGLIYLEGTPHPVTRTMELALRKLRRKTNDAPLLIWIDALCINQKDNEEKCEQVKGMRTIYQRATEVSIWLGPEDWSPNSDLAWSLLQELYHCPREINALSKRIQPERQKEFEALTKFFRRDYFWRIWVVQEVACATKATVYYGSDSMPWSGLVGVCDKLSDARALLRRVIYHDKPASLFSLMTGGPKKLVLTKEANLPYSESNAPPLLDLLSTHMSKGSTLEHDKVYGIVGISADRDTFGDLDYGRSVRDTYVHTARHIITKTRSLDVICVHQNDDNKHSLPSWVADWERRKRFPEHRVVGLRSRTPKFNASGSSIADVSFSENDQVLTAAGFVFDTITNISQPLYVHGPESDVLPTLEVFHSWWTFFTDHIGSTDENLAIFQRTFVGGSWSPSYSEGEFKEDQTERLTLFFSLIQRLLPHLLNEKSPIPVLTAANAADDQILKKREFAMVSSAALRMHAKRLVNSENKLLGFAPQQAAVGDKIVVLLGCNFPVVLREIDGHWELIGEIYMDGIMNGEATDKLEAGLYHKQKFEIH